MSDDRRLTMSDAADEVRTQYGLRVNTTSVWRWSTKGLRGVKLEATRIGDRLITSTSALAKFFAELSAMQPETRYHSRPLKRNIVTPPPRRRASARARSIERAERRAVGVA